MDISKRFLLVTCLAAAIISVVSNTILWIVGTGGPEFNPDGVQNLINVATVSSIITGGLLMFVITRLFVRWEIDQQQNHG